MGRKRVWPRTVFSQPVFWVLVLIVIGVLSALDALGIL